jgi:hypothetical protein
MMATPAFLASAASAFTHSFDSFMATPGGALDACLIANDCCGFDFETPLGDRDDLFGCLDRDPKIAQLLNDLLPISERDPSAELGARMARSKGLVHAFVLPASVLPPPHTTSTAT